MTQKFQKGDLVHVSKDLGRSMAHFTADVDAIVIGSYKDQYGGSNSKSYTLHLKCQGQTSWYEESQLELIEANRLDLLDQWERERAADIKEKSNLDWIFKHGPDVASARYGASIAALGKHLGITDMWGARGEGITWHANAVQIMIFAKPFLETKDKAGFLDACSQALPAGQEQGTAP